MSWVWCILNLVKWNHDIKSTPYIIIICFNMYKKPKSYIDMQAKYLFVHVTFAFADVFGLGAHV